MSENYFNEAKDKKGKGSGTKDACYHKVKSRYSVWPSAYASGALVKCRKVGAANWGNKSKNEGFSPMQVAALEAAGMIEIKEGQKCWKGYEKKGTKMMFGKRYNNCVKKKATKEEVEHIDERMINVTPNAIRKRAAKSIIKKDLPKVAAGAGALAAGVAVGNKMTSTNEGVEFLKREKEKKKSKSEYLTKRDAGKLAKRKMAKKDQEKVNFLEPEETNESKVRLVKNGHTYKVVLTWRGKTYMVQMFVPSVSRPTRQQIEKEVQKLYPDAKVMSFLPRDLEPGEPTVMMGEEKRDEYGDIVGGPKISKKQKEKNLAKNEKDEKITRSESVGIGLKGVFSNLSKRSKIKSLTPKPVATPGTTYQSGGRFPSGHFDDVSSSAGAPARISGSRPDLTMGGIKFDKNAFKGGGLSKGRISPGTGDRIPRDLYREIKTREGAKYSTLRPDAKFGDAKMTVKGRNITKSQYADIKKQKLSEPKLREEQDPEGIKLRDVERIKRQKQLLAKQKQAAVFKNKITRFIKSEYEYVAEDDMKGMSVKSGHKRPTKSGAGMTQKGVEAYRRRNPGSKLKTAVTSKVKKGSKDAKRRKSYCARSAGQMKKFPKAAKDPNSRLRQARRRWKC